MKCSTKQNRTAKATSTDLHNQINSAIRDWNFPFSNLTHLGIKKSLPWLCFCTVLYAPEVPLAYKI